MPLYLLPLSPSCPPPSPLPTTILWINRTQLPRRHPFMTVKEGWSPSHIIRSLSRPPCLLPGSPRDESSLQVPVGELPPASHSELTRLTQEGFPGQADTDNSQTGSYRPFPPLLQTWHGQDFSPSKGKGTNHLQLDCNENMPFKTLWPASESGENIYTQHSVTGFPQQGSEYAARQTVSLEM